MRKQHDRTKLPVWAQNEISRLERDVEYYKTRLAAGPEDSDTFANPHDDAPTPLGQGTLIQFGVRPGPRFRVRLQDRRGRVDDERPELEISADDMLEIIPWASNVVRVRVRR